MNAQKDKIIYTTGIEEYEAHRSDFQTCPECGLKLKSSDWDDRAIALVLEPRFLKAGNVTVISECSCGFKSWVHQPMDSFRWCGKWSEKWKKAVEKQHEKVKLAALREWAMALCGKCALLKSGSVQENTRRVCEKGWGGAEMECDKFVLMKGVER